ncbi:MAG TPA: DUF4279 domain-containing protein [Steroidobacteraceae bacterium]|nr:DUF4279 domain-containing protein [Steroidobacteraceae bacterium]
MGDEVIPIRKPHVVAEVGGMVDESRVTLAIYGDDLDPESISKMAGCNPTHAHRKGDRKTESSPPFRTGAWLLTVEGKAPQGPNDLIRLLLDRFPSEPAFWRPLSDRYQISVRVGIHTGGWNRGFDLEPATIAAVSILGGILGFDLYFYGEEGDDGV